MKTWSGSSKGFNEFMKEARSLINKRFFTKEMFRSGFGEGFVIRFDSGHMIKGKKLRNVNVAERCWLVKTQWYYNLSRGLSVESNTNSEKYLWKTVLENKYIKFFKLFLIICRYDDAKSFIAADERPILDKFASDLINRIEASILRY